MLARGEGGFVAQFVDQAKIRVAGGSGGRGASSILREKFRPLGGPDGGNGGNGGSVLIRADKQSNSLLDYHHRPHRKADSGEAGAGSMRHGKNAEDEVLLVPVGTVVKDSGGRVLADLSAQGAEVVVARGGRGGLGNAALVSRTRKAPGFALLGEPGEEGTVVLELKSIADVALVGYPSAGKSSLIAALSAARPKIADYPFTTLTPNLGVVRAGGYEYTVADVPGLIPGAAQGKGLGLDFLRHIERCSVIAHVIDTATLEVERDPVTDLETIEAELAEYEGDLGVVEGYIPLSQRPRVVVLNKTDDPDGGYLAQLVRSNLEGEGYKVFETSAVTQKGLKELAFGLGEAVDNARASQPEPDEHRPVVEVPALAKRQGTLFTVEPVEHSGQTVYQVRGKGPELWVRQTDFGNDEAVGYLADRLTGAGVEDELAKAGALPGDPVVVGPLEGGVIFDWEPNVASGEQMLGPRGEDRRLQDNARATRREKREEYKRTMDARERARQELRAEADDGYWVDPGRE